jgi:hypothetical protein
LGRPERRRDEGWGMRDGMGWDGMGWDRCGGESEVEWREVK